MVKGHAEIRIKRAYDPPDEADGTRVLVDRLWPRGLRKENAALTLWLKEIAPSPDLRKWFGHDPARWTEFSRRYRTELARNDEAVAKVADLLKRGPLTLLYAAHDTEHNHTLVLGGLSARPSEGRSWPFRCIGLSAISSAAPIRSCSPAWAASRGRSWSAL